MISLDPRVVEAYPFGWWPTRFLVIVVIFFLFVVISSKRGIFIILLLRLRVELGQRVIADSQRRYLSLDFRRGGNRLRR